MRDLILNGLNDAIYDAHHTTVDHRDRIANLTDDDVAYLADRVLASLSRADADSTGPTVTEVAAGPALVFSPADVIAMFARSSRTDVDETAAAGFARGDEIRLVEVAARDADVDYKAFRQFAWAIAPMFGAKVWTAVPAPERPVWRIGATATQRRAMLSVWESFQAAARTAGVDQMPSGDQTAFWATLGEVVTATDTARALIAENQHLVEAGRDELVAMFGQPRNLRRVAASDDAAIRDLVDGVLATAAVTR